MPFASGSPTGGYDSINRLRQYQRGVLSSTGGFANAGGGSVTTPISLPGTDEFRTYDLDGLGNWRKTGFQPVGESETLQRRDNNKLNQITRTEEGAEQTPFAYDGQPGASNGNLANDGIRVYEWDALNRLKKVYKTPSSPVLIGEYTYDALNRRIRKVVSNGGLSGTIPNGTTDFLYNSAWQCVEERDEEDDPTKQYLWDIYIDELIQHKTYTSISNNPAGNYYLLSDLLYRSVALTDDSAGIIETYDTDAYGNTLIFTAPGTADNWWADDVNTGGRPTCDFIFTGGRFEPETGLYGFRFRLYNSGTTTFLTRDPIEHTDGRALYLYVRANPARLVDPLGLIDIDWLRPKELPSERDDWNRLMDKAQAWAKKDWGLAATLLINFLSRQGAATVDLIDFSQYADKLKGNATFINSARNHFGKLAVSLAQHDCTRRTFQLDDKPGYVPVGGGGYRQENWAFSVRFGSGELFWAFHGADVGYENATLTVQCCKVRFDLDDIACDWQFDGTFRLIDHYTFPSSPIRSLFPSYVSAQRLEQLHGYKGFIAVVEWRAALKGYYRWPEQPQGGP